MKADQDDGKKGYYITQFITSEKGFSRGGEKMEPVAIILRDNSAKQYQVSSACETGKNTDEFEVQIIEEEVFYMADYEWDEKQEIISVRYDPVSAGKKRKVIKIPGTAVPAGQRFFRKDRPDTRR